MTSVERELIKELMAKALSNDDFIKKFTVDVVENPNYLVKLLEDAYDKKSSHDIEFVLFVGFVFGVFTEEFIGILCKLLKESWHYQHEDIARILQKLKSPKTVECLYETVLTKFEYLAYDNSYALARKCMWALGDINTEEAKKKIELFLESDDEEIRGYALEQLQREIW